MSLQELEVVDPKNLPIPITSQVDWNLLAAIHRKPNIARLKDVQGVNSTRGEINQTVYRDFITLTPSHSRLVKGVEIGRYKVHTNLSQGQREWFDEKSFLKVKAPKLIINERRIALQRITGVDEMWRLVGTIIDPPAYFADSTNSLAISDKCSKQLEYYLGLLNSRLMQWAFRIFSSNNNVGTNELDILPIRTIDFDEPNDVAKHKRMVELVTLLIDLHEQKSRENNPETLRHVETRINRTNRQIDRVVYDLYNLTSEEIETIERDRVADR